jgi:hypothetical protein
MFQALKYELLLSCSKAFSSPLKPCLDSPQFFLECEGPGRTLFCLQVNMFYEDGGMPYHGGRWVGEMGEGRK